MFWRGVIGYLPVNLVQGIVGVLTIVIFTRLLTPAQFGDYALGLTAAALTHTAVFTWNEAAMSRFWAREAAAGRAVDHVATIYRTWLGLIPALPAAALVALFLPMSGGLRLAILAGMASVLPRTLLKLVQERRRAAGEIKAAAGLDIAQTLGGFLAGVGMAALGLGGAAPLLGMALIGILCAPLVLPKELTLARGGRFSWSETRRNASFGGPVALSLILALALSSTDRFLLATFLDAKAVGVYHAGYSLANRTLDVVFIWLSAAGFPALVMAFERGGKTGLARAARDQASLILLLTMPAAVGLCLVAAPLSHLLIGGALSPGAAHVIPWIAASGLMAGFCTHYLNHAFTVGRRTLFLTAAIAVPAGANIALNLILIPRFGLDGALWSTFASYGLGLVASATLGQGALALPIPWTTLAQTAGASLLMALVVLRLPAQGGLAELALKTGIGGLVYALSVCLLDTGGFRTRAWLAMHARRAPAQAKP